MDADQYQKLASRTLNPILTDKATMINAALGLAGEAGEVADKIKKHLFHGHDLDISALAIELGDIQWYISQMAAAIHVPLSTVMEMNIEKLEKRYLEKGGFSAKNSINREENRH